MRVDMGMLAQIITAASKAGKNTGLYQKNRFFCEKTEPMFFFFSPFSPGDVRSR
jgi:hypothetical protein